MRPFPDATAWARLSTLFDTGIELAPELRPGWLASLAEDEPADLLDWLRDMLAAAEAGDDPGLAVQLPGRAARTKAEAGPKAKPRTRAGGKSAGKAAREAADRPSASAARVEPEPDIERGVEPAARVEAEAADAAAGRGEPPSDPHAPAPAVPWAAREHVADSDASDLDGSPTETSPGTPRGDAGLGVDLASARPADQPTDQAAAGRAGASADAEEAEDAIRVPPADGDPADVAPVDAGAGAPEPEADPVNPAPEPRLAAPPLATGMRLGPWRLVGPMPTSDARVVQWRARRGDADGADAEIALLVPWQWRPRAELAAWLAHASARARALQHPRIARITETGVSDEGTPWIACELAEGQSIERWCRDHSLAVPERRALMQQALEAAAFAHGRLVLHGQVHPSQVLLAPDGRLRFVNFGLSELLELLDVPDAPAPHGGSGPPPRAYVAPELAGDASAASGPGTTTSAAADVYALGLVAFEVLSGASPWQPRAPGKAVEAAAGSRWPRPSDFAGTARIRHALRGDLDAIVVKATQTDPARRYATAAELLDDIALAGAQRPVGAVDGGFLYQVGRVARRRPRLASAAMVAATVFVFALAALSWKAWIWTQEREQAEAARRGDEAVTRLLRDLLHEGAQPGVERDWPQTLVRAEEVARSSLKEQPAGLAAVLALLGRQQAETGAFAEARNLLAEALPNLADPARRLEAGCDEAWAQARQGDKPDEAEQRLRRVTENVAVRHSTRVLCLLRLADLERRVGRSRDAYLSGFTAWQAWDGSAEKAPQLALKIGHAVGRLSADLGRFHESQLWLEWAMKQAEALQQGRSREAIAVRALWSDISLAAGDAERAMKLADDNLAALTGSPFPADTDPARSAPASLFMAAAWPRIEVQRLGEARQRLERAIALADARDDAPMRRLARCAMVGLSLRERDPAAAERWLKAASLEPGTADGRRGAGSPGVEGRREGRAGVAAGAAVSAAASAAASAASGATAHTSAPPVHAALVGVAPPTAAEEAERAAQGARRQAEHTCRAAAIELALAQGRSTEAQRDAESLIGLGEELAPHLRAVVNLLRTEALLVARQHERAVSASLQALQAARALHQSDVEDYKTPPSFRSGQAALLVAEAHRARGDMQEANKNLAYAMQQLSATLPESHPWRKRAETTQAALAAHAAKKP